jgi:hypothetical protein
MAYKAATWNDELGQWEAPEKVGDQFWEHAPHCTVSDVTFKCNPQVRETAGGRRIVDPPRHIEIVDQQLGRITFSNVPMTIECDCGHEVVLQDSMSNYCDECDRCYNLSGQKVINRSYYEDTGETWSDVHVSRW